MTANTGFRAAPVTVIRPGRTPREANGPAAWWSDGTTYVLRFTSDHVRGFTMADELDSVLLAVDALTSGQEMNRGELQLALRDTRRLSTRLAAVADELLLYAREAGDDGRPQLSFRQIAEETGQHYTTVSERHGRVARGEFAAWRNWLVQHTKRDEMYPTQDGAPAFPGGRRPAHLSRGKRVHRTEVYDAAGRAGRVTAKCLADGCEWESDDMKNTVTAALVGALHEAAPENLAMRSDVTAWDRGQCASAELCRQTHPDGDTACTRPYGHHAAPDNSGHTDPLGRNWPVEGAQTLTGQHVPDATCTVCGLVITSGRAMSVAGGSWAHEACHRGGER
jgi:hypothetical protein